MDMCNECRIYECFHFWIKLPEKMIFSMIFDYFIFLRWREAHSSELSRQQALHQEALFSRYQTLLHSLGWKKGTAHTCVSIYGEIWKDTMNVLDFLFLKPLWRLCNVFPLLPSPGDTSTSFRINYKTVSLVYHVTEFNSSLRIFAKL